MQWSRTATLALLCWPIAAQHGSNTALNPYTGPEHAIAGAKVFRTQCANCHGAEGQGSGAGPRLNTGVFRRGSSDEAVFQTITKGVQGTTMPAFSFSGLQVWQLVTHLRSLSIVHGASQLKGNSEAGEALFRTHCSGCHAVSGAGGLLGPDLSSVGLRLPGIELRTALLEPSTDVSSEYWSLAIRTVSGRKLRGVRLNEDTHSVQIRDEKGTLVSVLRRDIAEAELTRNSPMPDFTGKMTPSQIEDLVAYLARLRGSNE